MSDDGQRIFGQRIRELVQSLRGDGHAAQPREEASSFVDGAAQSLRAAMGRWTDGASLRRFVGGMQRDILTSAGEWVELTAHLGVAYKLGSSARFLLDGETVAEVPAGEESLARAVIRAPAAGLYRLGLEVSVAGGETVSPWVEDRVLQVVAGKPLALIHVDAWLEGATGTAPMASWREAMEALVEAGFELAYVDIHDANREGAIREALRAHHLPQAALLVHASEDQNVQRLGLDFLRLFGLTVVRRLRAQGVPVSLIVTELEPDSELTQRERLPLLQPTAVLELAQQRGAFAEAFAEAERLLEQRRSCDPLTFRLDQATGSSLVASNRFTAELNNECARKALFEAIDASRTSVHLQFYIVRPSRFTEALIVKLIQRARAGVRVRLMVDALYSEAGVLGRENPLIASLEAEPNIEVVAISPIDSPQAVDVETLKKRDHRKVVIVDDQRAFVSGRNAADEYYEGFDEVPVHDNTPHERIPWLDAHVQVEGPLVRDIQRMFCDTWRAQGGEPAVLDTPSRLPDEEGSAAGRLVVHCGLEDANGLAMYEQMLDAAEHHAYIVNDFPFVTAVENAIRRLIERGGRVTLLTGSAHARRDDGSFFPGPLHRTAFELMVKAKLEPLMRAGVRIFEFVPPPSPLVVARGGRVRPYVHAKLVSVDGLVTSIGSANLDVTASFWESEANIVVQDAQFASSVEATLEELIASSQRLEPTSDQWRRERAQRAIVDVLWPSWLYS